MAHGERTGPHAGTLDVMSGKRAADYAEDYTDPELRERLKEEIKAGDRGGRPGQWSARKSQLLVREYEAAGGGYRHPGEKTDSQRHLDDWTAQEWTTADGHPAERGEETARYLPREAWEQLSPAERRATDARKRRASRQGRQHVPNTEAAKQARQALDPPLPGYDELTARQVVDHLKDAAPATREEVRRYEEQHKGRTTVLRAAT